MTDTALLAASRAAIIGIATLAMLVLLLNVFLPLDWLQRRIDSLVEWARKRPFIKRGMVS